MDAEYRLFKMAERYLCGSMVQRMFHSIDDFLKTAATILNRRKARAGWALEHHVERLLSDAKIPFEMRPDIDGKPDVIIPSRDAYLASDYPESKLIVLGIKRTCKDRWRQVLNEAKRVTRKHLLTIQPGISSSQITEVEQAQLTLIVPRKLHRMYPGSEQSKLLEVEKFVCSVQSILA
ncbi:MAG: type II restriction endonuclease [Planctomycetota bacterium]|nr:type II restriction endonuclease [Planctomycetota bacterium]